MSGSLIHHIEGAPVNRSVMPLLVANRKNMPKYWDELISFYQDLESGEEWYLVSMETLVKLIIENRDVSRVHPFTSHEVLCLTKYKTYDEWKNKPLISIKPASADNYWFSLTEPVEDGDIYRERSESISCPLNYALKAYDEMLYKLERLGYSRRGEA